MGLFSRSSSNQKSEDETIDDADLPRAQDIDESFFETAVDESPQPVAPPAPVVKKASLSYGIEEAIALMRNLPKESHEVVVTVVKKTLESTNIRVGDIIKDADAKETRLREQHKALEQEIKDLQEQISQRNDRITELLVDLKETTDVKQRLQLALEIETKNQRPPAPTPPVSPAVKTPPAAPGSSTAGSAQPHPSPASQPPPPPPGIPKNPLNHRPSTQGDVGRPVPRRPDFPPTGKN